MIMFGKRYLIKVLPEEETTAGGIIKAEKFNGVNNRAEILAIPIDAEISCLSIGDIVGIENANLIEVDRFDKTIMMVLEEDICFLEEKSK